MTFALVRAGARDQRIGDERRIFIFEADFADDLRCIPMVVRFKLDRAGIKLSLRQWAKIGAASREFLLCLRCDTHSEVANYRHNLVRLVTHHTTEPIIDLPLDAEAVWANPECVPDLVKSQATTAGLAPPTLDQWATLSALERFALLKLARSKHDNENFAPAMYEFGLCAPSTDVSVEPDPNDCQPGNTSKAAQSGTAR